MYFTFVDKMDSEGVGDWLEVMVDLVREKPQLWDSSSKMYRSSEMTASNWEEVANILGTDGKFITFTALLVC